MGLPPLNVNLIHFSLLILYIHFSRATFYNCFSNYVNRFLISSYEIRSLVSKTIVETEIRGSHSTACECYYFLWCDALFVDRQISLVWRSLLLPSSWWSSILKMKVAGSSELLVPICRTTWRHAQEDSDLHWWEDPHVHPWMLFMPRSNAFTSKRYFSKWKMCVWNKILKFLMSVTSNLLVVV